MITEKRRILSAKDLSKTFSNGSVQQHVLKNLNLSIYKGDFTVIMGNSGSGKSTLLYALSGMDRPSMGTVTYYTDQSGAETEISTYNNDKLATFRRDHVGFVFQQNYLNDSMSALDNVMVCGLLKNSDRKALAKKAKDLLSSVEIEENDYRKFPTQMSGGQQQRVAVVRGVINSPEVLYADEPTGALNSQNTENVLNILSSLNNEGQSIVMVTHTIKAAERGNRIIYLSDGVISDEIDLGPYAGDYKDSANPQLEKAKERHQRLKNFLQDMGW
ncbi:ABC transporter ATP-binding protein [Butyrivibrio sp. DSM 10294]|uniref:ABC transporter ATP-binding protein n=1 Tax=Butyrivibrio sp. DSM 10294 TaxID=2972457 RepID=UPI00234F8450|nr:ABC transporter ATP-binding protein [Butyrivibrio sp. DSM 10294]MDC7292323.1 ABC transporter ATP-binding protein [Butyrivibrio sp. DSM 10294]